MSTAWKYIGPGRHHGVPPRDITAEEYEALDSRRQYVIRESPIYEEAKTDKPKTKTDNAPGNGEKGEN